MKCIILAAGYATRLYPLTENYPKPLLEVKGQTILDWIIDDLENTKRINEYIIVSNHKYVNFFEKWLQSKNIKAKITIIDDGTIDNDHRLGALVDISLAVNKLNINEETMVVAGDNLTDFSLSGFINYFDIKKCSCIMRYFELDKKRISKSASVKIDENDLVLEMIEKPDCPNSNWCVPPFYIYTKDDIKQIDAALKNNCIKDSPGSFVSYLYKYSKMYAMEMPGKRYDIGTIENYETIKNNYKGIK